MGLASETTLPGDLGERKAGGAEEGFGRGKAEAAEVGAWGFAEGLVELAGQVFTGEVETGGDFLDVEGAAVMVMEVVADELEAGGCGGGAGGQFSTQGGEQPGEKFGGVVSVAEGFFSIGAGDDFEEGDGFAIGGEGQDVAVKANEVLGEGFGSGEVDPGEGPRVGMTPVPGVAGGFAVEHEEGMARGAGG